MTRDPEVAAKELLTTVWASNWSDMPYPIDPAKIAERLGVKVYAAGLEEKVSGMLVKHPARDPEIYLNGSDSKNRQRFSCAHELGHYVKRTSVDEEPVTDSWEFIDYRNPLSATGQDADEVWANKFAASLLMPRELVTMLHKELPTPAALAGEFGVSTDAMNFRLENLGLKS
jgi:Zn-dependent peptidase ImmA (M78 family)